MLRRSFNPADLATLLRALGLGLAGYLGFLSALHLPCVGGDCAAVLHSAWARCLGVPLGFYGAALWLVTLLAADPWRRGAQHLLAVGSLGLVMLQLAVIGRLCPWCMAHAALGIAAWPLRAQRSPRWACAGGLAVAGLLLAGQWRLVQAPPAIRHFDSLAETGVAWLPGPPSGAGAPVLVVSLTCPRCLDLLAALSVRAPPPGSVAPRLVFLTTPETRALTETFLAAVLAEGSDPSARFSGLLAMLLTQRDLVVSRPAEAARWFEFTAPSPAPARLAAQELLGRQQRELERTGLAVTPLLVRADGSSATVLRPDEVDAPP